MILREEGKKEYERVQELLNGKRPDQIPHFPFVLGFSAINVGYPVSVIYSDPQKSFDAQLKTIEQFGFDWGPIYGFASYGTWEFGGEIRMPTGAYEQAPSHGVFPVESESAVAKLRLPNVKTAGSLPIAMAFSQLQNKYNTPITVVIGSSFTIAGNICPINMLCRWIHRKPRLVHQIMEVATEHILDVVSYWVDTFGAERIVPQIWEPLASNDIISPEQFQQFVLPYLTKSSEAILAMKVAHIMYHICGDQNLNLPFWARVPMGDPGICSFGREVDLDTAVRYLGETSVIAGNINPQIIQNGSSDLVYKQCMDAIKKGRKAPRGYMLMSGCEIPPNSPSYNLYVMAKAIHEFGVSRNVS